MTSFYSLSLCLLSVCHVSSPRPPIAISLQKPRYPSGPGGWLRATRWLVKETGRRLANLHWRMSADSVRVYVCVPVFVCVCGWPVRFFSVPMWVTLLCVRHPVCMCLCVCPIMLAGVTGERQSKTIRMQRRNCLYTHTLATKRESCYGHVMDQTSVKNVHTAFSVGAVSPPPPLDSH